MQTETHKNHTHNPSKKMGQQGKVCAASQLQVFAVPDKATGNFYFILFYFASPCQEVDRGKNMYFKPQTFVL